MWSRKHKKSMVQTLGAFPGLSLQDARDKAVKKRSRVNAGEDIVATAKQFKDEDTFNALFDRWLSGPGKRKKTPTGLAERNPKYLEEDKRRYKLYVKKHLGNKKLSWFSSIRIEEWHQKLLNTPKQLRKKQKEGAPSPKSKDTISATTANRAFALVSTVFSSMTPERINPCKGVNKFAETSRERFLEPEELKRFFAALHRADTPELLRDYVLVSLFTGGRRSNVLSMQWNETKTSTWKIPAQKSKNGTAMDIPLIDEVTDILERRKKSSSSIFVFPGSGKTGHYTEPKKAWTTLLKRAGLVDIRLHDLRRTMGSYQTMAGASTAVVGKTLGHKSQVSTATYARMNLDPVRDSMKAAVKAMLSTNDLPEKVIKLEGKK
jgi:integrase